MKRALFRAKSETAEFLLADVLLVVGGIIVGAFGTASLLELVLGATSLIVGLFLGLRVLRSFSSDLSKTRGMIEGAAANLEAADQRTKKSTRLLEKQSTEIKALAQELRKTKNQFDDAKREIDEEFEKISADLEKIFGHSSTFSKFNWTNTLEDTIREFKDRLEKIERRLNESGGRYSGII